MYPNLEDLYELPTYEASLYARMWSDSFYIFENINTIPGVFLRYFSFFKESFTYFSAPSVYCCSVTCLNSSTDSLMSVIFCAVHANISVLDLHLVNFASVAIGLIFSAYLSWCILNEFLHISIITPENWELSHYLFLHSNFFSVFKESISYSVSPACSESSTHVPHSPESLLPIFLKSSSE